ncbi:MAG: MBL fold metallo-hydrolase [Coriobacteriia bacterium]|nr:MBL fold metallo-hydrolase [Coriobacteriia bacterium]
MSLSVVRKGKGMELKGACVEVSMLVLGPYATNTYFISDGKSTIVVDPSCQVDRIMDFLGGRKVDAIFATHSHNDHVTAMAELRKRTGAPVYASAVDAAVIEVGDDAPPCKVDVRLRDKAKVVVGNMTWKAMLTPGHTKGGMCFYLAPEEGSNPRGAGVLVSGDTLFCGSIGRTDFNGGNMADMKRSLKRLSQMPDNTVVLPGHNSLTTIADEQRRVFRYYC